MTIRNMMVRKTTRCLAVSGAAAALSFVAFAARAQESAAVPGLALEAADPAEKGDGTLSPAAKAAIEQGPLPFSDADVAAKAAANRARDAAEKSGAKRPFSPASPTDLAPAGGAGPRAPVVVGGFNHPGLRGDNNDFTHTVNPPDTTGAIGPTRFVQLVNSQAGIFDRIHGTFIGKGTLNQLAGFDASVSSTDPQVIWDPSLNRFFYTAIFIVTANDNRLGIGFSKETSPNNLTTDWCHYQYKLGAVVPDFPKLGHSRYFLIIGVNTFNPSGTFTGSDLIAISKPLTSSTDCPAAPTFKVGVKFDLVDATKSQNQVWTPVPAIQVDTSATGYVVARNGALPSNKLWFFKVTRDPTTGRPVFGDARGVTVGTYDVPPAASQPVFTQVLDTLDARNTQAVQALDPRLGTFSFWTQHTIKSGNLSAVRWYEIDPVPKTPCVPSVPTTPCVLRTGNITSASATSFAFNAAISSDRSRFRDINSAFGDSFVIEFNVSGKLSGVSPRIAAVSSVKGAPLQLTNPVVAAVGPYRGLSCPKDFDKCRWGDYSSATPDPVPDVVIAGRGVVWGTNQFSGLPNPPANGVNWFTQIFALKP